MTADIHTCSYYCERPGCIRAQRDYLAARLTAETSSARGEGAMSWQSIETSPKDVSVLVCAPGHEPVSARRVSRYGEDIWVTSADLFECFYPDLQFEPTHWMPLPGPALSQQPEARGGGGAAPPSAPMGVDFAAVASILRRAMRDGVHYGYRRDFILQQALALEALSQQPAAVDAGLAQRIQALVGGVEVDLEDPLREQEE